MGMKLFALSGRRSIIGRIFVRAMSMGRPNITRVSAECNQNEGGNPRIADATKVKPLLLQYPSQDMQSWAVSKAVGNVRNQGPQLM